MRFGEHVANLQGLDEATAHEMISLIQSNANVKRASEE